MSDEFLRAARQEIESDLEELERIVGRCSNDEHLFKNSQALKVHMHKIKGLAPLMGQDDVGEIARSSDRMLRHIMENGMLPGSVRAISGMIADMKKIFQGLEGYDMAGLKKKLHDRFPELPDL